MNSELKAGFARVDITPSIGTPVVGYFVERKTEGVLDALEVNAVALSCGDSAVIIMSVDNCGIEEKRLTPIREEIHRLTGVPAEAVFIHSTHTHTGPGPGLELGEDDPLVREYWSLLTRKCVDAAYLALSDLKRARIGTGIGEAKRVAFVRRFRMKDGSIMTNPGVNNPDIREPIGDVDERVNVVRIDREGAESIVIANFGNHPDTVGGNLISADWPGFTRRFVERAIENTKCLFLNGAQGDVNHVNVHPRAGDFNDMFHDFDGCSRGYGHARHIGRVVAGAVMQIYDKVNYVEVDEVAWRIARVSIPSNKPTAEQLPRAREICALHNAGRDDELGYKGMMLTTVVSEAARILALENEPEYFELPISVIRIGRIAFVGLPGEPFTDIGRSIKKTDGYDMILPVCCVNDFGGYFPTTEAYEEGGYEVGDSRFKKGVAEILSNAASDMLRTI